MQDLRLPYEADGVFEGGGVKGIALVGGLSAAEEAGVKGWKNLAGTSAGAIVACLVTAGYTSNDLHTIMKPLRYTQFADFDLPGKLRGLLWNQFRMRGFSSGRFFKQWLGAQLAASSLAKQVGEPELRFKHVVRTDLPGDLTPEQERRARYRLQVIASDVSEGRMLILPNDIGDYSLTKNGQPVDPDELRLVDAVRMSMSFPYLFAPVKLWRKGKAHFIVDGGLLSNFPVWLFDAQGRPPARPTWGFRLHGGVAPDEQPAYRQIPMPLWRVKLLHAMFEAATGAWDVRQLGATTGARSVSIPTGKISTLDFGLTPTDAEALFERGRSRARSFFESDDVRKYLEEFAARQEQPAHA